MEQIRYATEEDIPYILEIMNGAVGNEESRREWYVTDDEEFVRRHIGGVEALSRQIHADGEQAKCQNTKPVEGYTLVYIMDDQIAAFLIVRHPGEAEDNLGRYLQEVSVGIRIGAENNDEAVGMSVPAIAIAAIAHAESAAVSPAYRGKGLQGKLLRRAEELERTGCTRFLMATVHPDNIYSLRNLEAAGYKCILETEKYGGLRRKVMCLEL